MNGWHPWDDEKDKGIVQIIELKTQKLERNAGRLNRNDSTKTVQRLRE